MRFLVSEKPYETPLASGLLRYEQDGKRINLVETWRLTQTTHGDQILRIDFDGRAVDGRSFLYHLVMTEDQVPQRLVYRYLDERDGEVSGNLLFTDTNVLNSRQIGEARFEEELSNRPILFPTAIGAGFLARALLRQREKSAEIAVLDAQPTNARELLQLQARIIEIRPQRTRDLKLVRVAGTTHRATTLLLKGDAQSHNLWLDLKYKWPLKVERENGLVAHETRYIRYGV